VNTLTAALAAFTAFCNAFVAWAALEQRKYRDTLEDDAKANLDKHTPDGDLRAAMLSDRAKREQTQPIRPL